MGKEFNFEEEFMKNLAREELIKMFNEKDQQVAEKDKEIEKLKTIIEVKDETNKCYKEWLDNAELKLVALEKRAKKNFDAYIRCSKNYTELTERFEELKKAKAQELADHLHTSIPKYIVDEKVELLDKAKERVKNIRFNGLRENTQKLIKISVYYEINQIINELKGK